ncbi:hypothetical protein ACS0TY_036153 [Phlomoides rotata]
MAEDAGQKTVMEQKVELETETDECDDQEDVNPVVVESGQASEEVSVQCLKRMSLMKRVKELKKELETVIGSVKKEEVDDCNLEVLDKALQILGALKALKNPAVVEPGQVGLEMAEDLGQKKELETDMEDLMKDGSDHQEAVNPVVVESGQVSSVQCSKRVKELKKLEPVIESHMKEDDDDRDMKGTDNAIQILLGVKELKLKMNDKKLENPVVVQSGQESDAIKQNAESLLEKLPC